MTHPNTCLALIVLSLFSLAAACQNGGSTPEADAADIPGDEAGGTPSRWIDIEGSMNTRDLGGYPAADGKTIRWRTLIRSGHLSSLTEAGCQTFGELGIKTVIDLRMDSECSSSPPASCVTEVAKVVNVRMEKILPPSAETYLALMESAEGSVAPLFETLSQAETYPVLYHCIIGRDRANFANALIMAALGASHETILEEYRLGEGVEDAWIEAVLDEIDAQGGIDAYLAARGVPAAQVEALRSHVLE